MNHKHNQGQYYVFTILEFIGGVVCISSDIIGVAKIGLNKK